MEDHNLLIFTWRFPFENENGEGCKSFIVRFSKDKFLQKQMIGEIPSKRKYLEEWSKANNSSLDVYP